MQFYTYEQTKREQAKRLGIPDQTNVAFIYDKIKHIDLANRLEHTITLTLPEKETRSNMCPTKTYTTS